MTVAGFSCAALDQYSMPVPSGKPNSMRPPDMTSSIAYSSATRLGHDRLTGTPATMSLTRSVCATMYAARTLVAGMRL